MESIPAWAILAVVGAFVILALLRRLTGSGGEDMIERQRRQTKGLLKNAPPPRMEGEVTPHNRPSDTAAIMGVPEIRAAIARGRKVEAIKLVRERTGLGLREAKDLVDRAS